jgi:hypothetical protein
MLLRLCLEVSLLCLVGSAIGLVAGLGRSIDAPPLRFDPDPFVIPADLAQDSESDIKIDVLNNSDEAARIVGVREFCSHACFYGQRLPVTIPSHGRGQVSIRLKANDLGPIAEVVQFFTDRPTQPELTLRIEGNIGKGPSDDEAPIPSFKP